MIRSGVVVILCVGAGVAAADSTQDKVDRLFAEGREWIAKKNADEACKSFEAARALDPTAPGVLLNLGLCNEMRGRIARPRPVPMTTSAPPRSARSSSRRWSRS
jgi:hypothetical protein